MKGPVVYLGPAGTFAEMAARAMDAAPDTGLEPASSVLAALDQVRARSAAAAIVPIENSVEGSVAATLDEVAAQPPLRITEEIAIPVRFVLMQPAERVGHPIRAVGTHPHAAAQCRRWIHEHLPGARVVLTASTAGAAADLASGEAAFDAAIAPGLAAERYELAVLADDIADNPEALTRFVRVETPGLVPRPTGADKTSLVLFMKANRAGALLEILTELAVRGINLSRLESRPTRHALGDYCFSLDLDGHVAEARVGEALTGLRRACADVLFLGSYPRHDRQRSPVPAGVTDQAFADADAWLAGIRDMLAPDDAPTPGRPGPG